MIWQDIVISVICFLFGFMLFPQIKSSLKGRHVNVWSAGLTSLGLYIIAIAFATLDLWLSVISDLFSGTVWLILWYLAFRGR
jgi:hypothetical protein